MIMEQLTYNSFGYYSTDLSLNSHKRIFISCDKCGLLRIPEKRDYRSYCFKCSKIIRWERDKIKIDRELLFNLYINLKKSTKEISNLLGYSKSVINSRLVEFNIPIRTNSESLKGLQIGSFNPNWKGGVTPISVNIRVSKDYERWRTTIFERDKYLCQICGKNDVHLNVHHLYNFIDYPDLRLENENGITLCNHCHLLFHKEYGKMNNTPEQFDKFNNEMNNGIY